MPSRPERRTFTFGKFLKGGPASRDGSSLLWLHSYVDEPKDVASALFGPSTEASPSASGPIIVARMASRPKNTRPRRSFAATNERRTTCFASKQLKSHKRHHLVSR
jgi:hypothetical protein